MRALSHRSRHENTWNWVCQVLVVLVSGYGLFIENHRKLVIVFRRFRAGVARDWSRGRGALARPGARRVTSARAPAPRMRPPYNLTCQTLHKDPPSRDLNSALGFNRFLSCSSTGSTSQVVRRTIIVTLSRMIDLLPVLRIIYNRICLLSSNSQAPRR